jgi:hypothetical protein
MLVMWTHLTARDHCGMDPASARYMIRINGHLGDMLPSAYPALAWHWQGQEAVLTGVLDQLRLFGVRPSNVLPVGRFRGRPATRWQQ